MIRRDQIQQVKIPHNPLQLYFQSSCGGNKPNKPCKGSGVECNVLRVPTLSQVETDERTTVLVTPEVRTDGHHETPLSRFGTYQRPQDEQPRWPPAVATVSFSREMGRKRCKRRAPPRAPNERTAQRRIDDGDRRPRKLNKSPADAAKQKELSSSSSGI